MTSLDVSGFDTSKVTTMNRMFYNCWSLTSLDLSSFDTSNVTDMDLMFLGCGSIVTLDFGNKFDMSNVTTKEDMCGGLGGSGLLDITCTEKTMTALKNGTGLWEEVVWHIL